MAEEERPIIWVEKKSGKKEQRVVSPTVEEINYEELLMKRIEELVELGEKGAILNTKAVFGKEPEETIRIEDFVLAYQEGEKGHLKPIRLQEALSQIDKDQEIAASERREKRNEVCERARGAIQDYVRRVGDRWEELGEGGYPGGLPETEFRALLRHSGDPQLEEEYDARRNLRLFSLNFGQMSIANIEGLLIREQREWAQPLKTMGTILHRLDGVGETIQLAEIEAKIGREGETDQRRMGELGWLREEEERILKYKASTMRGERLRKERLDQIKARIIEIEGKRDENGNIVIKGKKEQYEEVRAELNQKLGQLPKIERERALRLAEQIREVTGLRAWGDFVAPSLRSEDPLLTRAFANRILGALFHNDGFLRAAKPEHLDLLYYTPFVDLSYTHLFKESNVPQIGNFMAAAGFSEIDESGQKTGEFDPSQVDMALLNLAEIDMQLWADGRNQGAYLEWIRKLKKADGARGAIIIALQEKEMSLRTVKELMGKFDYLLKDDQKPYERFFMSLATPSEMARFRGVRASGSLVVPAIRQALSEGALSAEIWETYLKPAGIDQELGEFVTQPPPPEKIARLIINALWGRNKELKRLKLKPGDLIDSLLGEFRQARDYPLSRELVAFAGLKVMENGSLAEDVPNKEGRRWGDWLPEEARAEIAELLMQPGGFFEIADKFDIDKIVDTAIRAYIKAEERGDLYKVWTDFFVISDNLTDLKGRRLSDLDPLRDYMRGDGVDPIKDPLKHAARDGVIITDPDAIRITEWYLLTHDDDWVDDNARVGAHYAQILTSIDKARIFESLGEREARLIIGEAREDFEHRVGAWWLPRWWFRLKMWPLFGVVDAMKKEEKETAGGSAFRNGLRMVFSAGPTGIFGKILEIPVLPTSLLDASMMAAVGGFCTGLGWPTIPAYLVGGLAAKLGYNFSLSALVRAGLRSSRCPAFLRTWDYPYDPDGIISKKIIEDYTNVFTKPR